MSDDLEAGIIKLSYSVPLMPWGVVPANYWFLADAQIASCLNVPERVIDEELAGQIVITVIKFAEAMNARMNFRDIFREASLDDVHDALFNKRGDFKEKLEIPLFPGDVLFINSVKLKAKHRKTKLLLQAIEAIIPALSSMGLVFSYRQTLDLGKKECKKLCFDRIPGTDLVYRNDFEIDPRRRLFQG